ncbi:WD40 repeat protein [Trachipleistophora hominis]|uniref:WD40 repeat protein n=1 Tax=Trachipleistophora hominis TaxID=72359 RepID=L7JUJ1_TRAHO|nr:WD40 repeat protein [Trachipleistophora hominis]
MVTQIDVYKDFQFPTSCTKLKLNNEQTHVIAVGTYPPQYKVYVVEDNTEFFERRMDTDIVDFCFLTHSPRKLAFLRDDKTIEFHLNYNLHYKLRIPHFGRCLNRFSDNLYFCTDKELYRIDLARGAMSRVYNSDYELNTFSVSRTHGLSALFSDGQLAFVDARQNEMVKHINFRENVINGDFDANIIISVATDQNLYMFDLRNMKPFIKSTVTGATKVICHEKHCFVAYSEGIDIYDNVSKIDTLFSANISTFDLKDNVIFVGYCSSEIKTYYTGIGIIPKWCSYAEKYVID